MLLLLSSIALCQPTEVIAGQDLAAWREIRRGEPEGEQAVEAYRWFVERYPTSPLAEVAYGRLVELHAEDWRPDSEDARAALPRLQRSLDQHQRAVQRAPSAMAVAPLNPDGSNAVRGPGPWHGGVAVGGGWDAGATVGVRVYGGHGPLAVGVRAARSTEWLGELGVRLAPPVVSPAFLEVAGDTRGVGKLRAGASIPLDAFAIEASAGPVVHAEGVGVSVLIELAWVPEL